jgi:hypothetical protein
MKDRLLKSLARLSSERYQDAFIVHGTKSEYVLPEDLVEDVASLCTLAQREDHRTEFVSDELVALGQMLSEIRSRGRRIFAAAAPTTAAALVHESQEWLALRAEARRCLATFCVDADDFVKEEINQKEAPTSR